MSIPEDPPTVYDLGEYAPVPIVYQLRYSILKRIRAGEDLLPAIQGRQETKKDVVRALLSGAHPYLVSEEGTGKTRLARSLTSLLPPVFRIKGCPYNDDPRWPASLLCPRCRESQNPGEQYGIELLPGHRRFSRIQGNEYTNEAKLLGLKDIHAIIQGKSPSDPSVFAGTGVFRANRGILFVDELPAIRTNVQVLLHPILEEKRAILEEYNWQHPLDLIVIATGNPRGFSHVYEVPRPLLDRLELVYMDMPGEEEEKEIMLLQRFGSTGAAGDMVRWHRAELVPSAVLEEYARRTVAAPWWIVDLLNLAVRHSRTCQRLEKKASIRASSRALDHTYASVELENRQVASLRDALDGLKLALRGRIALSSEYQDWDEPRNSFLRTDRLVEDLLWNALEDFKPDLFATCDTERLAAELTAVPLTVEALAQRLPDLEQLGTLVQGMLKEAAGQPNDDLLNETELRLATTADAPGEDSRWEYVASAIEVIVNLAVHRHVISEAEAGQVFRPRKITEGEP